MSPPDSNWTGLSVQELDKELYRLLRPVLIPYAEYFQAIADSKLDCYFTFRGTVPPELAEKFGIPYDSPTIFYRLGEANAPLVDRLRTENCLLYPPQLSGRVSVALESIVRSFGVHIVLHDYTTRFIFPLLWKKKGQSLSEQCLRTRACYLLILIHLYVYDYLLEYLPEGSDLLTTGRYWTILQAAPPLVRGADILSQAILQLEKIDIITKLDEELLLALLKDLLSPSPTLNVLFTTFDADDPIDSQWCREVANLSVVKACCIIPLEAPPLVSIQEIGISGLRTVVDIDVGWTPMDILTSILPESMADSSFRDCAAHWFQHARIGFIESYLDLVLSLPNPSSAPKHRVLISFINSLTKFNNDLVCAERMLTDEESEAVKASSDMMWFNPFHSLNDDDVQTLFIGLLDVLLGDEPQGHWYEASSRGMLRVGTVYGRQFKLGDQSTHPTFLISERISIIILWASLRIFPRYSELGTYIVREFELCNDTSRKILLMQIHLVIFVLMLEQYRVPWGRILHAEALDQLGIRSKQVFTLGLRERDGESIFESFDWLSGPTLRLAPCQRATSATSPETLAFPFLLQLSTPSIICYLHQPYPLRLMISVVDQMSEPIQVRVLKGKDEVLKVNTATRFKDESSTFVSFAMQHAAASMQATSNQVDNPDLWPAKRPP